MGEAYPGSTGGEIFNYYGTDGLANIAEGAYSTVIGKNNKVIGGGCEQPFVGGYGNKYTFSGSGHSDNNFIFGTSNEMGQVSPTKKIRNCALFGFENKLKNTADAGFVYMIGQQLETTSKGPMFVVGQFNNDTLSLSNAKLILACGATTSSRKNAIEINTSDCKILHKLQLASDSTAVNAIVAPSDPSNPTTDEQTLATKAYVDSHSLSITVPRAEVLLTGQSTTVANGASISLETDLSLTLPSWTKQIRLGIHNSGGYVEYLLVDNISAHSYVSVTGAGTIDEYSYDPATTTFTFVSGGTSMSIVSVRAEGTANI